MSIDFNELSVFKLLGGGHADAEKGVCAMEAVAWLEGLPHSDAPACTCPVIAAFVRVLNDAMPDLQRQQLIPYLPRLIGTVSPEHELQRAYYLAWHAITVIAPDALDRVGLPKQAAKMRALPFHHWLAAASVAAAAYNAAFDVYHAANAAAAAAAAARAAYAAHDAATAAYNAYAAYKGTARNAATAAYAAANAVRDWDTKAVRDWAPALRMLDGVLAIGPQSRGFSPAVAERVAAYRELVREEG